MELLCTCIRRVYLSKPPTLHHETPLRAVQVSPTSVRYILVQNYVACPWGEDCYPPYASATGMGAFSLSNSETDDENVDAVLSSEVCVRSVASLTLLVPLVPACRAFLERLIEHVAALTLVGVSCQVMCSCAQTLERLGMSLRRYEPNFFKPIMLV